jgi:hypothetical protein
MEYLAQALIVVLVTVLREMINNVHKLPVRFPLTPFEILIKTCVKI